MVLNDTVRREGWKISLAGSAANIQLRSKEQFYYEEYNRDDKADKQKIKDYSTPGSLVGFKEGSTKSVIFNFLIAVRAKQHDKTFWCLTKKTSLAIFFPCAEMLHTIFMFAMWALFHAHVPITL